MTVKRHTRLRELLNERWELVPCGGLVEQLREVKQPAELARIRAASELADTALREVLEAGLAGRTEREVAIDLELRMRRLGAAGPSFPSIVAAGPHAALPHAEPRAERIAPDTLVTIDWGALLDGTARIAPAPTPPASASPRGRARCTSWCSRLSSPASPPCARAPTARDRCRRPRADRAGRLRRALRPRPRPRRRPRGARGSAPLSHRGRGAAARRLHRDGRARHLRSRSLRRAHRGPGRGHRQWAAGAHRSHEGAHGRLIGWGPPTPTPSSRFIGQPLPSDAGRCPPTPAAALRRRPLPFDAGCCPSTPAAVGRSVAHIQRGGAGPRLRSPATCSGNESTRCGDRRCGPAPRTHALRPRRYSAVVAGGRARGSHPGSLRSAAPRCRSRG